MRNLKIIFNFLRRFRVRDYDIFFGKILNNKLINYIKWIKCFILLRMIQKLVINVKKKKKKNLFLNVRIQFFSILNGEYLILDVLSSLV